MCQQQSFVILICTPNGFGIDNKSYKSCFLPVWPCSDLEMILKWSWSGTPVKHNSSLCQLSYPILYPSVSIMVMGAQAEVPHCYILVFFSFIPALGKGCNKRNTKGYLPPPGWKFPKNHWDACLKGTRERMCEQKSFVILSCTTHQFSIGKSKINYVFIPIWPWNEFNLTLMWPWSCIPLNHNIITCHYLLLVWDPAGVFRTSGSTKYPAFFLSPSKEFGCRSGAWSSALKGLIRVQHPV